MDKAVCREHLWALLGDEAALLEELEELLTREAHVLETSDIRALEGTTRARQERMGALARLEEQRGSLCGLHGFAADRTGLEALMGWCDPQGALIVRLRDCATRAMRCRDLNDRNGVLVSARLQRVQSMLGALTDRPARLDTYGPKGYCSGGTAWGRSLGAA